jgi:ribosomal protein S18 acetylase RimI-like enzyme
VAHVIREPTVDDADAMGRTHVRAWQAAYRGGLMPDDYLDGLVAAERSQMWRSSLTTPPRPRSLRLVGESANGLVVGFIVVGPAEGDPGITVGELYAINVDPTYWGSGLGADLIERGTAALAGFGFSRAVLWVHPGNERARRFYESRGWISDGIDRQQSILGVEVPEIRYSVDLTEDTAGQPPSGSIRPVVTNSSDLIGW